MKVITFCSYWDNPNKARLIIDATKELLKLGKKVFLIDCNLPAPSLHHLSDVDVSVSEGLVDYILFYQDLENAHTRLEHFVVEAPIGCFLLPAGNAPSTEYASKLLEIDWKKLFPKTSPSNGINLFLFLKEQIEKQYQPDVVLINTPSGITDIGTVASGFLSDISLWLSSVGEDCPDTMVVVNAIKKQDVESVVFRDENLLVSSLIDMIR